MSPPEKATPTRLTVGLGLPAGPDRPGPDRPGPDRPGPGRPAPADALLLVGHGSQCVRSAQEMRALARMVGDSLPDVAVEVGFLEMNDPPAGRVLDRLAALGSRRVTVLPLVLLGAGHAKSDVPAVVLEGRRRHPEVEIVLGSPLGVSKAPVEVLGSAVVAAGGAGLPLLVVARGTSDPDANAEAHKAARLIAEWTSAPFHHVGFSGVTTPLVPEAARVFSSLGFDRMAVAWWYLCHGKLIEQGRGQLAAFRDETGTAVLDAGHIGPHPGIVGLVVDRYGEAAGARGGAPPCDLCAYRAAWPGIEDRVGQALGVGHSHLAVEHLHRGSTMALDGPAQPAHRRLGEPDGHRSRGEGA